jgi:cytochrome c-type biogenesis protein CcsB
LQYTFDFSSTNYHKCQLIKQLDHWIYRAIGPSFSLSTIGTLSGAIWANEEWGSYWSWDPRETWQLITWTIFTIYLHTRMNKGWQGEEPTILASLGFSIVWIRYLGVDLLEIGLHNYGWLEP